MNNDYWINEDYIIFKPEFNKSISNYIHVMKNYKKLIFSNYDDYKICISTNNIYNNNYYKNYKNYKYSEFNQPILNSLNNLTQLQQLTFGYNFDQELNIQTNVKILKLNCNNRKIIDYLPNSIEELYLGYYFNLELNDLPKSLEKLYLPKNYNMEIKNINPKCVISKNSKN